MTPHQVKRGFRRVAIVVSGGWFTAAFAMFVALAVHVYQGPFAQCPGTHKVVSMPPTVPELKTTCTRVSADNRFNRFDPKLSPPGAGTGGDQQPEARPVRPLTDRQLDDLIFSEPVVDADYSTAFYNGHVAWESNKQMSLLFGSIAIALGVVCGAIVELFSWILRGFMRA